MKKVFVILLLIFSFTKAMHAQARFGIAAGLANTGRNKNPDITGQHALNTIQVYAFSKLILITGFHFCLLSVTWAKDLLSNHFIT